MLRLQNPVTEDAISEAGAWYYLAAEQGLARAQISLGLLYEGGKGVPKDAVEALKWYTLASTNARDEQERDFAVKNFNALAQEMTSDQIEKAQQLAREWKSQANFR
jgi:TPR repeat protein